MALTPDELLNKEFPETKFRPGYDKDEVDDFLDEVVVEWRRLIQENQELKDQVSALEAQLDEDPSRLEPAELDDAGLSGYAGTEAHVAGSEDADADTASAEDEQALTAYPEYELGTRPAQPAPGTEPAGETGKAGQAASAAAAAEASDGAASSAAGVLAMAQKLHDQYVSEGEQTRAQYIAEGEQARAEYIAEGERRRTEIVAEAETRAEHLIEEAELTSSRTLSALEGKKADLESRLSELTSFERDYRARLQDYIEAQLAQLNSRSAVQKESGDSEI